MRCSTPNTKTREAVDNSLDIGICVHYNACMEKATETLLNERPIKRGRRSITLCIRFSPEERAAIERAAAREYRCVGDYVRYVVLKTLQCNGHTPAHR